MSYIKDYQKDHSNYISVNELIKPKKRRNYEGSSLLEAAPFSNLRVSRPDDPAEIEADKIAGEVTGGAPIAVQAKLADRNGSLQAKDNDLADNNPSEKIQALKDSGGVSLPENTKEFFEEKMGADFSKVRIHNDQQAHESAAAINAKAFTVGNRIAFGKGEYNPG
ncbi:MAG TPA: DUF4157 domain-containing protein, partial [Bacillota bacterium]|nr:DUF4157 domain-containing protein [Bacillota bacterium]